MPHTDESQLPRGWPKIVRTGLLQALAPANIMLANTGSKKRGEKNDRQKDRQIAILRETLELARARMARVPPHRRPHYTPPERMRILELKALEGWSLARTADEFQITEPTVAFWLARIDEPGPAAIIHTSEPVNKFPFLVMHLVQRLKVACPALGTRKLAAILAREGLHLAKSTVGRMLKKPPANPDLLTKRQSQADAAERPFTLNAKRPHHFWHIDLTLVPTGGGFWVPWIPFALPQRLPYGWWTAAIMDRYSRRVLTLGCYADQPSSRNILKLLKRTFRELGAKPRTIVCDRGPQFDCKAVRAWCKRRKIKLRYGAVGKHGSIALIERLNRTLKEFFRSLPVVPRERNEFMRELSLFQAWYNEYRPHESLGGKTPNEVYEDRFPGNRKPRFEPRAKWPRGSPCAKPWALTRGTPGAKLELDVRFHGGRRHLPLVTLRRVA